MKKKTKRFLSFLLTVLMVLSGTTFAAFAGEVSENGGNKETLLLVSASADTIIFKAEEGYEYAVQMEKTVKRHGSGQRRNSIIKMMEL